ncbi:hypothetical protein [Actinomycetospora sp. CA-053990]|uniref:hypothetical protein n=1 Tax=Actinomycetospora sp. CA-053990 TaxID=3239891 RepID=UPI003D8D5457
MTDPHGNSRSQVHNQGDMDLLASLGWVEVSAEPSDAPVAEPANEEDPTDEGDAATLHESATVTVEDAEPAKKSTPKRKTAKADDEED